MKSRVLILVIWAIILVVIAMSCSSKQSNPVLTPQPGVDVPVFDASMDGAQHELFGVWSVTFDVNSLTATIEPNREMLAHFNVRRYLPFPAIVINSYDPVTQVIDVDVTMRNPYTISGYDLRLIVYIDSVGHSLKNPDGWTGLYDKPGGMGINPFKAYAKGEPKRIFKAGLQHVENLLILLPNGNTKVDFAVDVSYPSNCPEPYKIYNFHHEPLSDELNASADAEVYVSRWDTLADVYVQLECPLVLGGNVLTFDTDDFKYFSGKITNYQAASVGEYMGIIKARTELSPIYLYDIVIISVTEIPINGWAAKIDNSTVKGTEIDQYGDSYVLLNVPPTLSKYNSNGSSGWSRVLSSDSPYYNANDIENNGYMDFINVAGSYSFCDTRQGTGLIAGRYGLDNYKFWTSDKCLLTPSYANVVCGGTDSMSCFIAGNYKDYVGADADAIMGKLDSSGNIQWSHEFPNAEGTIKFTDMSPCYAFETIFGIGTFWGTSADFDPSSGVVNQFVKGETDAFLTAWDSNGNLKNVVSWGDSGATRLSIVSAKTIALDSNNNIFVVGDFSGQIDFDPAASIFIKTSYGGNDIYVSKLDSNGNFLKAIRIGGTGLNDLGNSVAIDMNDDVYFTGCFDGTVDFDPGINEKLKTSVGDRDVYLAKFTNNLTYLWVLTWGDTQADEGIDVECAPDTGNIILVGTFLGTVDFNPGEDIYQMTSTGSDADTFIMNLLPSGYW